MCTCTKAPLIKHWLLTENLSFSIRLAIIFVQYRWANLLALFETNSKKIRFFMLILFFSLDVLSIFETRKRILQKVFIFVSIWYSMFVQHWRLLLLLLRINNARDYKNSEESLIKTQSPFMCDLFIFAAWALDLSHWMPSAKSQKWWSGSHSREEGQMSMEERRIERKERTFML